ncbi:hypothetical protein I3842_11G020300 [Carya illinoinensis]|uniref:Uncharacterized protein n=1 Tax=Carya illinoinensis TaxID=32201 RepID=A0A922DL81_CARIL|nr:hypothetical protein I3842_11G020300 [Carya illinoinensis]
MACCSIKLPLRKSESFHYKHQVSTIYIYLILLPTVRSITVRTQLDIHYLICCFLSA